MQKILNNANFSGFNIEYGRGGFALLFLAEYGRIIFINFISITEALQNFNLFLKQFLAYILYILRDKTKFCG